MIRLFASIVLNLLANTAGFLAAAALLSGFRIDSVAFVMAVVIFTIIEVIVDPLITKMALTNVPALRGGVALVTTFVTLVITNLLSSGFSIDGISTWVIATLVIWLFSLIATLILPLVIFKKTLDKRDS
jgi:uncharacterized membrane protein YvlD (DUF360 family)